MSTPNKRICWRGDGWGGEVGEYEWVKGRNTGKGQFVQLLYNAECVQYCILEYGRYYSFLNKKDREIGNYNTVC